jgi:LysR family glycine cleavage system transcriptional activator
LVAPFGAGDPTGAAYYLCRLEGVAPTVAVRNLERWLRALAAAT